MDLRVIAVALGIFVAAAGAAVQCPKDCTCRRTPDNTHIVEVFCQGVPGGEIPPVANQHFVKKLTVRMCWVVDSKLKRLDRFTHLREVDLSGNGLNVIPVTTFAHLTHLEFLNLTNSSMIGFENTGRVFHHLKKLKILKMARNDISEIPDNLFHGVTNLESIDLSHNDIRKINVQTFKDLRKLLYLNLDYNDLTVLPKGIFNTTIELKTLSISHNSLEKIEFGVLDALGALIHLNLGGEQLFDQDFHLCALEIIRRKGKGQLKSFIVNKGVQHYLKHEKPCEMDCRDLWPCPRHTRCEGTIAKPTCVKGEFRGQL